MIVVKLSGGLGNQMLQYALAIYFKSLGKEVELDISSYQYVNEHYGPELFSVFNVEMSTSLTQALESFRRREERLAQYTKFAKTYKVVPLLSPWKMRHIFCFKCKDYHLPMINLNEANFNEEDLKNLDGVVLYGCAKPVYINKIDCEVRRAYAFPNSEEFNDLISKMSHSESVAVHVRRGDYLNYQNLSLPDAYYHAALAKTDQLLQDPHYFIFSEDEEYVKELFGQPHNITFVYGNTGTKSFWDMYLMSQCKHNIIANSTFSWWSAWLNDNADKIVVRPKKWFDGSLFFPIVEKDNVLDY